MILILLLQIFFVFAIKHSGGGSQLMVINYNTTCGKLFTKEKDFLTSIFAFYLNNPDWIGGKLHTLECPKNYNIGIYRDSDTVFFYRQLFEILGFSADHDKESFMNTVFETDQSIYMEKR